MLLRRKALSLSMTGLCEDDGTLTKALTVYFILCVACWFHTYKSRGVECTIRLLLQLLEVGDRIMSGFVIGEAASFYCVFYFACYFWRRVRV